MDRKKVAVIGGTGNLGSALAARMAQCGHAVVIGSRDAAAAQAAAAAMGGQASGDTREAAAAAAEIVVVAVPFSAQEDTYRLIAPHVAGKIVIDTTVPLVPPKVAQVQLPPEGSAAKRAERVLAEAAPEAGIRLVAAFHNVAAHRLGPDGDPDCDILVFGDDVPARREVARMIDAIGLRGIEAGVLGNAVAAEALTSLLIGINRTYKVDGAGLRITGELTPPA